MEKGQILDKKYDDSGDLIFAKTPHGTFYYGRDGSVRQIWDTTGRYSASFDASGRPEIVTDWDDHAQLSYHETGDVEGITSRAGSTRYTPDGHVAGKKGDPDAVEDARARLEKALAGLQQLHGPSAGEVGLRENIDYLTMHENGRLVAASDSKGNVVTYFPDGSLAALESNKYGTKVFYRTDGTPEAAIERGDICEKARNVPEIRAIKERFGRDVRVKRFDDQATAYDCALAELANLDLILSGKTPHYTHETMLAKLCAFRQERRPQELRDYVAKVRDMLFSTDRHVAFLKEGWAKGDAFERELVERDVAALVDHALGLDRTEVRTQEAIECEKILDYFFASEGFHVVDAARPDERSYGQKLDRARALKERVMEMITN